MLDEPTNHLDVDGVNWLANHLKTRWNASSGGLLVITHDRWFLDAVCNTTWEVVSGRIEPFSGGYAAYVQQRAERSRQQAAIDARRRNLLRKELAWLGRGAPARTAKPKFRIDAALELIGNEPPPRDAIELSKLATARLGKDVVDLEDVSYQTPDGKDIFKDITLRLGPADRIGLVGSNGAGKTTTIPPYEAVLLVGPSAANDPTIVASLEALVDTIDVELMREANLLVDREESPLSVDRAAARLLERIGR